MIRFRPFLIAALLCIAFPAASVASVFSCPDTDEITMIRNNMKNAPSHKKWQSNLQTPTKGMPRVLATAKYETSGKLDEVEILQSSDMPLKIHFDEAVFSNDSELAYFCYYKIDSPRLEGLTIALSLRSVYLPDSLYLPLIPKTSGNHWVTNKKGHWTQKRTISTYKVCSQSAKDCAFQLPRVAVRTDVRTHEPSADSTSFRIRFSFIEDLIHSEKEFLWKRIDTVEHQTLDTFEGKTVTAANITLIHSDFILDINESSKAIEGKQGNEKCDIHSKNVVKCSCSSKNLIEAVNANGHVILDLFADYKKVSFLDIRADCNLFFIPGSTEEHEPHDDSIKHDRVEL